MKFSLENNILEDLNYLKEGYAQFEKKYKIIEKYKRFPIQTLYGGAHLFKENFVEKLKKIALSVFKEYINSHEELENILKDFDKSINNFKEKIDYKKLSTNIYKKVLNKLEKEPIEDYRIDFEDGYGVHTSEEEDFHAQFTAKELAKAVKNNKISPFIGIRIKPFNYYTIKRAIRTLDIFITSLIEDLKFIPENFRVTLPKIFVAEEVKALSEILDKLEKKNKIKPKTIKIELMLETSHSILNLENFIEASNNRCDSVHFGAYDFTAYLNIIAPCQDLLHPICNFARNLIQLKLCQRNIRIVDSPTVIMPLKIHKGDNLSPQETQENKESIIKAWRESYKNITNALFNGYYQGWDLHPAQLPIRYISVYKFFLEYLQESIERLNNFIKKSAKTSVVGNIFDDAATGQGLLNFFLKGIDCGALDFEDIKELNISMDLIKTKSFSQIMNKIQNK